MADVDSRQAYDDTPAGRARLWTMEFGAAKKELEKWQKQGDKVIKRFRDEGERGSPLSGNTRWPLFTSNVQTQRALLYGRTPQVSVARKFADASDDVARVAAEMLERLLNCDISRDSDSFAQALQYALDDRLLPGLGFVRLRYVVEMGESEPMQAKTDPLTGAELAPAVPAAPKKVREDVETDYVNWRDLLFSAGARTWEEARWLAFRNEMSREDIAKRWGEDVAARVPMNSRRSGAARRRDDEQANHPLARADVWEILDKERREWVWFVEGYSAVLETRPDILGLEAFWPCPRPMLANTTTSSLIPKPDLAMAQDLYDEIDTVSTRITLLERAIKVAGVYNKAAGPEVGRLLSEACENELIPVDAWAMFAEKGGLRGQIDFLPIDQIVHALTALRDYRTELIDALYQVTGMSDIMRGQATEAGATATEQRAKVGFGSVRIRAMQDEFARFASDALKVKAEIIAKHFDVETIIARSNVEFTADAHLAQQAAELIKSRFADYRIEVKPENVNLTDFAALKQERTEVIGAISQYLTAVTPLAQAMPGAMPFLLQILQWMVSGLRGASTMESVLDQAIAAAQQQAQQPQAAPPPDPKLEATRLKGQLDMQKVQAELQADVVRAQVDAQAEEAKQRSQTEWNVREQRAKDALTLQRQALTPPAPPPRPRGGPLP